MRKLSSSVGGKVDKLRAKPQETELPVEDPEVRENILAIQNATLQNETSLGFRQNALEEQYPRLLEDLKNRFDVHMERHPKMKWSKVLAKLESRSDKMEKLRSLYEMESTGGEPDVVGFDKKTGEFIFFDCSKESPRGRSNLNYDEAVIMARTMGITILNERQYRQLQTLVEFDNDHWNWSWVETLPDMRKSGYALRGRRIGADAFVSPSDASYDFGNGSFRGSLSV